MLKKSKTGGGRQAVENTEAAKKVFNPFRVSYRLIAAVTAPGDDRRTQKFRSSGRLPNSRSYGGKWTAKIRPTNLPMPEAGADKIAADTEAVKKILRRLLEPKAVDRWLNKKLILLGNRTPEDMIRRGETERVIEILARVEEGIHL